MKLAWTMMVAGVFALAACENKPVDPNADDPTSKNSTTAASAIATAQPAVATPVPATPPTIAEGDLSTPADFAESAEKSISKANYKTELASLETDIGKE